jgi:hypothetical protein
LAGLRGKTVLLTFVESYGRIALEGGTPSSEVRAMLDASTRRLRAEGYSARSAYLTSSTFGGQSWVAHSTLQSGLWVDNPLAFKTLLSGHRLTLTRAFQRAGWRTVGFMPSNRTRWPEGRRFYGFDRIYNKADIAYAGPPFGWAPMPDQYALSAFDRLELARRHRGPVMAELDLTSSHWPWRPLPRMADWNTLGDGSVFERIHEQALTADGGAGRGDAKSAYVSSIRYSLRALLSYIERYGDDDLVVIFLGDHQPSLDAAKITDLAGSGRGTSHDVPITIVAHDPAVVDQIAGWGWQEGLRPAASAPVWTMDAFRDRFLTAYSPPRLPTARPATRSGSCTTSPRPNRRECPLERALVQCRVGARAVPSGPSCSAE